jgi:putative membrane-bound dehydrogenase-like protein
MPLALLLSLAFAQIPHAQDKMPGPALSPQEALKRFKAPPGFQVKLFAAEPDVVNPVAMTFDERGRVWVCESLEYPRKSAGPGKDRIRILEDTDGDGKADKVSVYAEGLNIPSGILHGYGGVFVCNSPDLLFLKDTDGDGKADTREVLLTGFGRDDTHELPNSLIWGPDGWLYGLNGVFNESVITHQGKTHKFTCACWRYHPRTKKFELFCEGTSNPWGLDYNEHGDFFVSACVIDHLWHLTETGYYHRQGGAYPPFTWKIESIVDYKHQKAAYCGLCFYDADTYPEEYRRTLFMGNIHGNCINNDAIKKFGASYKGSPRPDFLSTDDAWFMPVVQKVGPDGCLWVVDWYDRYHCYQDANRDPAGIDRLKGRIYRVTYNDTPMAKPFDLSKLDKNHLHRVQGDPNIWKRREARRVYIDKLAAAVPRPDASLDVSGDHREMRLEDLWMSVGAGWSGWQFNTIESSDVSRRAWGVRFLANDKWIPDDRKEKLFKLLATEQSPEVLVQLAIAAPKLGGDPMPILLQLLAKSNVDPSGLLPRIVWRNVEPHLDGKVGALVQQLQKTRVPQSVLNEIMPRMLDRCLAKQKEQPADLMAMIGYVLEGRNRKLKATALAAIARAELDGESTPGFMATFRKQFGKQLQLLSLGDVILTQAPFPETVPAMALFAYIDGNSVGGWKTLRYRQSEGPHRILLVRALAKSLPNEAVAEVGKLLRDPKIDAGFARELLSVVARIDRPESADLLLSVWKTLPPEAAPQVLDALATRPAWAARLMDAVEAKQIPTAAVNVNQIRRMAEFGDKKLAERVGAVWGQIRSSRNPNREKVVADYMKFFNRGVTGNATNGAKVYEKHCAQCHQFRGKGVEVGPKLDENGRTGVTLLVSNMLDPSLVIGKDYQARLVLMADGRSLTGLVVEDSPTRVVLKVAGDKREVLPKDQIEKMKVSDVSMMPEDLERQMTPQEFRDLVAYLMQPG